MTSDSYYFSGEYLIPMYRTMCNICVIHTYCGELSGHMCRVNLVGVLATPGDEKNSMRESINRDIKTFSAPMVSRSYNFDFKDRINYLTGLINMLDSDCPHTNINKRLQQVATIELHKRGLMHFNIDKGMLFTARNPEKTR